MSTANNTVLHKLKLWDEILNYLDRTYDYLNRDSMYRAEWSHLNHHQEQMEDAKHESSLSMILGYKLDPHGNSFEDLKKWHSEQAQDSESDKARDAADAKEFNDMVDLRVEVVYQIREELAELQCHGRKTVAAETFGRDLAEYIGRAEKERDEVKEVGFID